MSFDLIDNFSVVKEKIKDCECYFDFPSSLIAFSESLKNSSLFIKDNAFFRKLNLNLSLITYSGKGIELKETLTHLFDEGFKIKSLNFFNKDFEGLNVVKYGSEYLVNKDYSIQKVYDNQKACRRSKLKNKMKRAEQTYVLDIQMEKTEVFDVFQDWCEGAKSRHFMVVKGHYSRYLKRFFEKQNNVHLLGFRRKDDAKLFGVAGFEIFRGCGQLTIMKHRFGDYTFSKFFWVKTVETILKDYGVQKIFCGSTADDLKRQLHFNEVPSYKIKL